MCNCIQMVNEKLKPEGLQLEVAFLLSDVENPVRPEIHTAKIDPKSHIRPKTFIAAYCPFCGTKYPDKKPALEEKP